MGLSPTMTIGLGTAKEVHAAGKATCLSLSAAEPRNLRRCSTLFFLECVGTMMIYQLSR